MAFKFSGRFLGLLALLPLATAQSQEWGSCGGLGWTGPTTCVAGTTCVVSNPYFSFCLPDGLSTYPPPPGWTPAPELPTPPTANRV